MPSARSAARISCKRSWRRSSARTRATNSRDAEWLGQVVVGAHFEANDAVGLFGACGQHQHGQADVWRTRRSTSRPSKPGSIQSSTIRSGVLSATSRTADGPSGAWRTA